MPFLTKKRVGLTGALWLFSINTAIASTQPADLPNVLTDRLLPELAGLFVVATIMESALTTLFNWRLFREFFNGRAVKTLVMIGFGYAIVSAFQYDVVSRIIGFAGGKTDPNAASGVLSALVLAGGSAAVFELFKRFGLRTPANSLEPKPQPSEDKAWISVRIIPVSLAGPVSVYFEKVENMTPEEGAAGALSGVLSKRTIMERLKGVFMNDPLRFPPSGGRTVEAGAAYRITVKARRRVVTDNVSEDKEVTDEIFVGRFAGRAIIDFVHTI